MLSLKGKGVCGGVTLGTLAVLHRNAAAVKRRKVQNAEAEVARFQTARQEAIDKLAELYEKAVADVGKDNAAIFEIHQMMLEDLDYIESVEGIIRTQQVNAEYAVQTTAANFAEIFSSMEDDYMRARAADVKDISNKVLGCLGDAGSSWESGSGCYILAADDLAPSETVQLDKSRVQGFVTAAGSVNSHTAILARTIGIPAVVNTGCGIGEEYDGKLVAVDGYTGEVFVDPDEATLERIKAKMEQDAQHKKLLEELKGKKSITGGGQQVHVYANLGGTVPRASVFSAANSFTWKARIIRPRSSSLKSISWQRKQWPASVLLSARLISVLISRLITSSCRRRKIRRWAIAQSVSVWKDRSCLLRSCALSAAPLPMASWQ